MNTIVNPSDDTVSGWIGNEAVGGNNSSTQVDGGYYDGSGGTSFEDIPADSYYNDGTIIIY